jgi:hypothetical protein
MCVITRRNIGTPYFTQTARDTWENHQTIFLALLDHGRHRAGNPIALLSRTR